MGLKTLASLHEDPDHASLLAPGGPNIDPLLLGSRPPCQPSACLDRVPRHTPPRRVLGGVGYYFYGGCSADALTLNLMTSSPTLGTVATT